jgi:selenocysteine lyase/cysteine desulfurase
LASVLVQRHTLGDDEVGFEDGTIDYLGLPAIEIGLRHLASVGIPTIHRHVRSITRSLVERMAMLRHRDGEPMIRLYGPTDEVDRGGTVAFNLLDSAGGVVDFWKVEASAADRRISVRTGCFCNPGASETARGLTMLEMDRVFALGRHASIEDLRRLLPGRALGAVRASVGIATTGRDISRFVAFLQDQASDEV